MYACGAGRKFNACVIYARGAKRVNDKFEDAIDFILLQR